MGFLQDGTSSSNNYLQDGYSTPGDLGDGYAITGFATPSPVYRLVAAHFRRVPFHPGPPRPRTILLPQKQAPRPSRLPKIIDTHFASPHYHGRGAPRVNPPTAAPPGVMSLSAPVRGARDYLRRMNDHFKVQGYQGRGRVFIYGGASNQPARASQIVTETLIKNHTAARASQIVTESLIANKTPTRVSQIVTETLYAQDNPTYVRASQIVLEVLVSTLEAPSLLTYPNLIGLMPTVTKRPKWSTGAGVASSGREVRIGYWQYPQWEWELAYDILNDANAYVGTTASDIRTLIGFFLASYGSLQPFFFQDPDDYQVTGQPLGFGDGATTTFLFSRTYGLGESVGTEPIGLLNTATAVNIYVNGVAQSSGEVAISTAVPYGNTVTFATAPPIGAAVTADFQFYYLCRFADDSLDFDKFMKYLWDTKKVALFSLKG